MVYYKLNMMDVSELTLKQNLTYQFLKTYILKHGFSPTEAEIAKGIGIISRGVVHRYLTALQHAGYIELISNKRRNIRLTHDQKSHQYIVLPVLGNISAGQPIEAIEDRQEINVSDKIYGSNRFLLKVKGDSMRGDYICDGDFVICESSSVARTGQIVVALIDREEATLKRYKMNNDGTISLIPSNPALKPEVYKGNRVQIQGIYVGLLRFNV